MTIKGLIQKIKDKLIPKPKYNFEYVFAFECNGTNYYKPANIQKFPSRRIFQAQDVFEEMDWRIEREDLLAYLQSVLINANQGHLVKIVQDTTEVKKKVNYITNLNLLYKLGSIYFFDLNENVYDYDHGYALKKIDNWMTNLDHDFFLRSHLSDLFPYLNSLQIDIQKYMRAEAEERGQRLTEILSSISAQELSNELWNNLDLQKNLSQKWLRSLK